MKKILFSLFVVLFLFGCSNPSEENAVIRSSEPVEVEDLNPVSAGTYQTSDLIVEMDVDTPYYDCDNCDENVYHFGGFVDEDTFTVTMVRDSGYRHSASYQYYYTFTEGTVFNLPHSNMKLKVTDFDLLKNQITLEQLK